MASPESCPPTKASLTSFAKRCWRITASWPRRLRFGRRRPLVVIGVLFDLVFLGMLAWAGGLLWIVFAFAGIVGALLWIWRHV